MGGQLVYDITLDKEISSSTRGARTAPPKLRFSLNQQGQDRYECFITGVRHDLAEDTQAPIEPVGPVELRRLRGGGSGVEAQGRQRQQKRQRQQVWQLAGITGSGGAAGVGGGAPVVVGDVVFKLSADGQEAMAKAFVGVEDDVDTVASANWRD